MVKKQKNKLILVLFGILKCINVSSQREHLMANNRIQCEFPPFTAPFCFHPRSNHSGPFLKLRVEASASVASSCHLILFYCNFGCFEGGYSAETTAEVWMLILEPDEFPLQTHCRVSVSFWRLASADEVFGSGLKTLTQKLEKKSRVEISISNFCSFCYEFGGITVKFQCK